MNTFTFRAAPTAAIIALAALAPSFAGAVEIDTSDSQVAAQEVFYGDLNLQNTTGVMRLHARIERAATEVCGGDDRTNLAQLLRRGQCRSDAIVRAVAAVNLPQLSQYHERRELVASR